jgi:predicted nucleic acid-binding protein
MSACFADTYFFIALLFETDEAHALARTLASGLSRPVYTSMWVLTEVADAMAIPGRRENFSPFLRMLRANPQVIIAPADSTLFDRAVALYDQRPDKEWSLTDCVSFIIMQDFHLIDALTGDHHFRQAGFNPLMK